jgi:hypothetical protein
MLAACLAVVASLAVAGCGNKEELVTLGETEGIYVTVDGLKYQVQLSRILNPASAEDQAYVRGVAPADEELEQDEVWFGIFMRVENDGDEPRPAADEFVIRDTQEAEFEPLGLDRESNVYAYEPREIPAGNVLPMLGAPAYDNTVGGALILFKVKTGSLYNRPLELEIASPSGGDDAVVDLDV